MPKRVKNQKTKRNNLFSQVVKPREKLKRLKVSLGRFLDSSPDYVPFVLIAVGILLLSIFFTHKYFYWRSLSISKNQVEAAQLQDPNIQLEPKHVYIQWFVDADIETMALVGQTWGVSQEKVSYLYQSARPGQAGNIVLYGHNRRDNLGNIRALKGGEKVTLTTRDGKQHLYKVTRMQEVNPSDVKLLQPTDTEVLTMYTCSGLLDSMRFIVQAVPIQDF